jgi:hypothetical protein
VRQRALYLCLGLVIFLAGLFVSQSGSGAPSPKKWRYEVRSGCTVPAAGADNLNKAINFMINRDWEVSDIQPTGNIGTGFACVIVVLKKMDT